MVVTNEFIIQLRFEMGEGHLEATHDYYPFDNAIADFLQWFNSIREFFW